MRSLCSIAGRTKWNSPLNKSSRSVSPDYHRKNSLRYLTWSRFSREENKNHRHAPVHYSPYLTVEEAAAYCRVAVQTIYNHRREIERLPGLQRKLLFRRETLDKWLETRRKRK